MKLGTVYSATTFVLLRNASGKKPSTNQVVFEMDSHSFESPLTIGMNPLTSLCMASNRYGPKQLGNIRCVHCSRSLRPALATSLEACWLPSVRLTHVLLFYSVISHPGKIETDHFICTIDLNSIAAESTTASKPAQDQMVGIWISSTNITDDLSKSTSSVRVEDWKPALTTGGFGMNGVIPPKFSGVGVILSYGRGTIHFISSDGSTPSTSLRLDDSKNVLNDFEFRKSGVKLTLSVNRKRGVFSVYAFDSDKKSKNLEVPTPDIPRSGFFGITAYSGSSGTPYRVTIPRIKMMNLDLKSGTGEGSQPIGDKNKIKVEDLLHDDDFEVLSDPLHQIADLRRATSVLSEYLADSRYRDSSLVKSLGDIQGRAHALQDAINDLRAEIKMTFKSGGHPSAKSLLGEIRGLEELIKLHAEENQSLEGLRSNLLELGDAGGNQLHDPESIERISASNRELEEEVSRVNFTANLVIGVFGFTVVVLGLVLYIKMRQYEKKHFL